MVYLLYDELKLRFSIVLCGLKHMYFYNVIVNLSYEKVNQSGQRYALNRQNHGETALITFLMIPINAIYTLLQLNAKYKINKLINNLLNIFYMFVT